MHAVAARGITGPAQPLPHANRIRRAFGRHDVRGAQAHLDAEAAAANVELGSLAFTTGQHVAFAGEPSLHTVAHEATHIVEQRAGVRLASNVGTAGDAHERYADRVADKVVRGESAEALLDAVARPAMGAPGGAAPVLQLQAAPTPKQPKTPPAKLDPARTARQRERATILRETESSLRKAFAASDAALPATTAFEAMFNVRFNVQYDLESEVRDASDALDVLELALSPQKHYAIRADHGFHAPVTLPYPDFVQDRLERATLTAYLLPIYGSLAALVRAIEIDRLIPDAAVAVAHEAHAYAKAFDRLDDPALGRAQLAELRSQAPIQVAHTRSLLSKLGPAIARGEHGWHAVESALRVIDVPLDFAKGLVVPPHALFANLVLDETAFAMAHEKEVTALYGSVPAFLRELHWLYANAKAVRQHILNPLLSEIGWDSVKSIRTEEVAFAIGRIIKDVVEKQAAQRAAGTAAAAAWKLAIVYIPYVVTLVSILDSPVFVSRGIGKLADQTSAGILKAIGGNSDPYGVVRKVNETLHTHLSAAQVAELLNELVRPDVQEHLHILADATAVVGPNMAAILADIAGTGQTSRATVQAAQAQNVPLLPPAP
jgi:hypothetical protein